MYQYTDHIVDALNDIKDLKCDINEMNDNLQHFYVRQSLRVSKLSDEIDDLRVTLRWHKFLTGIALATLSTAILLIVHTIA